MAELALIVLPPILLWSAWLSRKELQEAWQRQWVFLVAAPLPWLTMTAVMRLWPAAGASNSEPHLWVLKGALACSGAITAMLVLRQREATTFVVIYAVVNMMVSAAVFVRYGVWLNNAL